VFEILGKDNRLETIAKENIRLKSKDITLEIETI
jgi:hypothetical protein